MEKIAKDKYILFLDVDGTVFDGKDVPDRTADALMKAKQCHFFIKINSYFNNSSL